MSGWWVGPLILSASLMVAGLILVALGQKEDA
jgi:hypothetical protein